MNSTEKISATAATTESRTNLAVFALRRSARRQRSWASADRPYGMADVMPVISTSVLKTVAPLAPRKLTSIATDAKAVEAMMPAAGTPRRETRPNIPGNSPSRAAAYGISAQIIVQPVSAPSPDTTTASAARLPAQVPPPTITSAATEYDALFSGLARSVVGTAPNTAISDRRYTVALASVPNTVARGTLRPGSRTFAAAT